MLVILVIIFISCVLGKRFILRFPKTCMGFFLFGCAVMLLDHNPSTQGIVNKLGLSQSLAISAQPLSTGWGIEHDCGEGSCFPHRYAVIKVTNSTGHYYTSMTYWCSLPDGDGFYLSDGSGIMPRTSETRVYKIEDQYSKVVSCRSYSVTDGKPETEYSKYTWGERVLNVSSY